MREVTQKVGNCVISCLIMLLFEVTRLIADNLEIKPYHLVASSRLGDSSVLLLDSRGCPTGQVSENISSCSSI